MMTFQISIIKHYYYAHFSLLLAKNVKIINFENIIIARHYQGNIFGVILLSNFPDETNRNDNDPQDASQSNKLISLFISPVKTKFESLCVHYTPKQNVLL